MEEIDEVFKRWFNQAQPLVTIRSELRLTNFTAAQAKALKTALQQAYTAGYGMGFQAHVAGSDE